MPFVRLSILANRNNIDLAAASRVAKRVDIREIRLIALQMDLKGDPARAGLVPMYEHSCAPAKVEGNTIEVACSYTFQVRSEHEDLAAASMTYRIVYTLIGEEPADQSDIDQFAKANGAYHSWPFVREMIFSLTSKMGFPPYTLPVLIYRPKAPTKPDPEPAMPAVVEER